MKNIILILVVALTVAFASFGVVEAGKKLVKGEEFAQIGIGSRSVTIYKVQDGSVTCYISIGEVHPQEMSCVK